MQQAHCVFTPQSALYRPTGVRENPGRVSERLLPVRPERRQDSLGARDSNPGSGVARDEGMVQASIAFALNQPARCGVRAPLATRCL